MTVYLQDGDGCNGDDIEGDGDDGGGDNGDGDGDGGGNWTWRGAKPFCRCLFLGRWLNHRVPLMLSMINKLAKLGDAIAISNWKLSLTH